MSIAGIRRGEGKLAFLLFSYFFLITTPHTIIKALKTTNLLVRVGVGALPLAFLITALLTALIVVLHSKIQFKVSLKYLIIVTLFFFVVTGLILQLVLETEFGRRSGWLPYAYWVWASILIVVCMAHFGMTINELFNPREAKRLIGFIGTGGILGGVLGGLLAGFMTRANKGIWLLPLACVLMFACTFVVKAIYRNRPQRPSEAPKVMPGKDQLEAPRVGFKSSFNAVRKSSYLSLIAAIVAIGIIVSTFIEFQFFSATDQHFRLVFNRDQAMQAFFGFFFGGMPLLAFFLNTFLMGKLLKKMRITLLLVPVILLAGSLVLLIGPFSLFTASFVKGSDESLDFSLKQTLREILYIPVKSDLKFKAKPFIDMFISRAAKVTAALILLVFALLLNKRVDYLTPIFDPGLAKSLSWIVIAFLIPWMVFSLKVGREYVMAITGSIQRIWKRVDRSVTEKLDVDSAKEVFDLMDSRNRSSIIYAMHIFDLLERDKLTPEIKSMISEKAGQARASSLGDLFNAEGCCDFPDADEEVSEQDLITDVREILSMDAYQELMKDHAEKVMDDSARSEVEKMELAKAIGLMSPDAPLTDNLEALIDDNSPDVASYALKSAARIKKEKSIPAVIRRLGDPRTREDAIDTLHKYGEPARRHLEESLIDGLRPLPLRQAVVEVLARFGTRAAASSLMDALERGTGELDSEIIDALDRIHTEKPDIRFPDRVAKRKTWLLVKKYCRAFLDLQGLEPTSENDASRWELQRTLENSFSDIFKLLGLFYPHEEIHKAYQNIKTGTRNSVAYAVELLDNTLKKDVRDVILPLVEDLTVSEKRQRFEKIVALLNKLTMNERPTNEP
jgi:AAA family ATP:ADP antiporter